MLFLFVLTPSATTRGLVPPVSWRAVAATLAGSVGLRSSWQGAQVLNCADTATVLADPITPAEPFTLAIGPVPLCRLPPPWQDSQPTTGRAAFPVTPAIRRWLSPSGSWQLTQ